MIGKRTSKYKVIGKGHICGILGNGFYEVKLAFEANPMVAKSISGRFEHGDPAYYGHEDGNEHKVFLFKEKHFSSIPRAGTVISPPSTNASPTTIWVQSMASVRKDWMGRTSIDFSLSGLDVAQSGNADWPIVFAFDGDPNVLKGSELPWPSILIIEEKYSNIAADEAANNQQTLALLSNKRNGFNIEGNLYLYRINDASNADPNESRSLIESIEDSGGGSLELPFQPWSIPFNPFDFYLLPNVSNAYARPYNNTLLADDYSESYSVTDKIHFTFIQPCIMNLSTGLADTSSSSLITIEESFDLPLDGSTYQITLSHKAESVVSTHSGDGSDPMEDQFSAYTVGDSPDNDKVDVETVDMGGDTGTFYIEYQYSNQGNAEQFYVLEVNLTRRREFISKLVQICPSIQANAVHTPDPENDNLPGTWAWPGWMGAAHISIGMNVMIQAHIASRYLRFLHRPENIDSEYFGWMYWIPRSTQAWESLISEIDNSTILPAWKFFNMGAITNNAPAKIKEANLYPYKAAPTDEENVGPESENLSDAFVLPYFSFYGEKFPDDMSNYGGTFTSKYWYIKAMMKDDGTTSSSALKVLERTNPTSGEVSALSSLDDLVEAAIKNSIETSNDIILDHLYTVERYFEYACPIVVPCEFILIDPAHSSEGYWGPNVNDCADPCWIDYACNENPEIHGCVCYDYDWIEDPELGTLPSHQELLGVNSSMYKWGGFLEGSVTDFFGTVYPNALTPPPEKQGLNNIIVPLPLMFPNQSANEFSKCCWTARSDGTGELWVKDNVDPQLAISESDGYIYSCIIEGRFIKVPTGSGFSITSNEASGTGGEGSGSGTWDGGPETPEPGIELCGLDYTYVVFYAVGGGCEGCMTGERDPETGEGGWSYLVPPEPRRLSVTLEGTPGNTYSETTYYATREIKEVRETKLVISNKDVSSVLTVPISKPFSGIPFITSGSGSSYTISEELHVPENVWQIGLWKDFVILLIDDRDEFNYMPRPILQIRNRFTGAKVAEYKTIVPDDLYNDRWSGSDPFRPYMTKWVMHGRFTNQGFYGPRFKLAYLVNEDGTESEGKPLYIHVSNEIYSIPEATNVNYSSTSRVEYRILKFDGSDITESKSVFDALAQDFLSGHNLDEEIQFSEKYPRPGALGSMAITKGEVFLPAISRSEEDPDVRIWNLISHQAA